MRYSLTLFALCASLLPAVYCAPPLPPLTDRGLTYFDKYDWPLQAWGLLRTETIPADTYTDQQATEFVKYGMVYLERLLTTQRQLMNSLGSNHELVSASFVYGIDDTAGHSLRPRWRWVPLIESLDNEGEFVYLTSTWANGVTIKSMDVLRFDSFLHHNIRLLMPTAIVRPIQRQSGFGRGLQFTTVYEFPTSFAHFLREPTVGTAKQLHYAMHANNEQWISMISHPRRKYLREQLKNIDSTWLYRSLYTYMNSARQPKKPDNAELDVLEQQQRLDSSAEHVHQIDGSQHGAASSSHVTAVPINFWDGRASNLHASDASIAPSSEDVLRPWVYAPPSSQGAKLNTVLQLGMGDPGTRTVSSSSRPLGSGDIHIGDHWLQLGTSHPASSMVDRGESASAAPANTRGRIARWRRPPKHLTEHAESP